jgi:sporulation protein YlmC with PRC-barrel domain
VKEKLLKYTAMKNFDSENLSGENQTGLRPNTPLKFLTASSVIGDKVANSNGDHLGSIKDIMIDLSAGKIEYVVVELGGFLGIGEKYFAIPFALLKVDPVEERFILNQTREALDNAPGFDKDHWPETNSHALDNSTTYWGGFMGANTGGAY